NTPLPAVWRKAVEAVKVASQIVVIGYSLPPTDTFFQYLLTLGLGDNPNLHRVVIVNPDHLKEFKERYRRVFSRSLDDRGRLKFLAMTFTQFADGNRMDFLSFLEWRREFGADDVTND